MKRVFLPICLSIIVFLLYSILPHQQKVYAAISGCTADIDPGSLPTVSEQTFTFTVSNDDSSTIARWVRFQVPHTALGISSASSNGWGVQNSGTTVTFVDGSLNPETTTTFTLNVSSGADEIGAQPWTVTMSSSSTGTSAVTCGGDHSTAIEGQGVVPPEISDVTISDVAYNSVKISFTTSANATSVIEYGTDEDYGTTSTDTTSSTSHSHTLTGLTANTTYHFLITATNDGGDGQTDDATFTTALTASATSTPGPTSTPIVRTNTVTNTVTIPTATPTPDKKPPVVTLERLPNQPYKEPPTIKGNAVDNDEVANAEYSIDNGKTWTRITNIKGLKTNTAEYSFIPQGLKTGTSTVSVRAKDTAGNTSQIQTLAITIDQDGPIVLIATDLTHPYEKTPEIAGKATDNSGESSVAYSIDGKNWNQVDSITIENSTDTSFRFTPPLIDDGNYPLMIRATDALGNVSEAKTVTLIVDRLPPRFGGFILSIGPQLLESKPEGFVTLPNLFHTLTVSVIGGPIVVSAEITPIGGGTANPLQVPLHKIQNSNLWTADISLPTDGTYTMKLYAKDGASHEATQDLPHITALPSGKISDQAGKPVKAIVTLYTKDSLTGTFIPWDAAAYGQQNPQTVPMNESYAFYPPSGTYYIGIERSFGHAAVITNSFTITSGQPLSPQLILPEAPHIKILGLSIPLPSLFHQQITVSPPEINCATSNPGCEITAWTITSIPDKLLASIDPTGIYSAKTTTLVLLNTWHPQIASYIERLEQFQQQHPELVVLGIVPHESRATVDLFAKRGSYTIPLRADPDGDILQFLPYSANPTLYTVTENLSVTEQKLGL